MERQTTEKLVSDAVAKVYQWIDSEMNCWSPAARQCSVCGKCCNFGKFGHRLFITSPEMIYLSHLLGTEHIKLMPDGICPYNIACACSIHNFRFAGCRIFFCKGPALLQNQISEEVSKKFKAICNEFGIDYLYADLAQMLRTWSNSI